MLDRVRDPNIRVIYATILSLGVAYGLAISLIGTYLEKRGFSKEQIGSLAIWFAGGIVILSLPVGSLVKRLSGKRVLVASLFGYALTVAAFPFMPGYFSIGALRFLDGAFSVGVWVASETILLSRAPPRDKAYATSLYAISLALGYVIGPLLARGIAPTLGTTAAFLTAGVIGAATAIFVTLKLARDDGSSSHDASEPASDASRAAAPSGGDAEGSLSTLGILGRIKTSCLATFSYGYFQASVVLFLPLFLKESKGLTEDDTIIVPAFFAAGMLLFANVAARVGDRVGHLLVMRSLGLIGTLTIAGFLVVQHHVLVFALVFSAGASLASVSPVSLALQGSVVPPKDLSRAGGLYNASYALGMLLGPPITSQIYGKVSGEAMVKHFGVLWALFVIFTIVFRKDDPRARGDRAVAKITS